MRRRNASVQNQSSAVKWVRRGAPARSGDWENGRENLRAADRRG